jgi:alanine racemase
LKKQGKPQIYKTKWYISSQSLYRPTWVEIDTSAFKYNLNSISKKLKNKTKIMAVVKANAYGHMAVTLARIAANNGASALGVSSIEEALELRNAGIRSEILILGSIYPLENFSIASKYNLTPSISSMRGLNELVCAAKKLKIHLPFHLKVDTGMGRVGVSHKGALRILDEIMKSQTVSMKGLYTHFAVAGTDKKYTDLQLGRFNQVVKYAKKAGLHFTAHTANSSAILKRPDAEFDMVRPGLMLYGMYPFHGARNKIDLKPVLCWKTKIVFLKDVPAQTSISYSRTYTTKKPSKIATLPVGYADGYMRRFSNKADVLVRGIRCRVIGRVTMDMIMIDVSGVKNASIGDEVVLIGPQGQDKIRAEELANIAGTINYEITCSISYRVPRVLV